MLIDIMALFLVGKKYYSISNSFLKPKPGVLCLLEKHYASKSTEDQRLIRINSELASGFMPK
jgi:hypothetical protein